MLPVKGVNKIPMDHRDKEFLLLLHPITKYFNYEPCSNGIHSRDNLPRIKDRRYVINLSYKKSKEQIGFHYLLAEMQLCTMILLGLIIFLKT